MTQFKGAQLETANELLNGLNPEQAAAVSQGFGPSLVVAGAGSGKTTVLTRRAAFLVRNLAQRPESILAVTFTNKAAKEMKDRLTRYLTPAQAARTNFGTFHSICARLLRQTIESYECAEGWHWSRNFIIYDETDSLSLIKSVVARLNLDEKVFAPKEMRNAVSSLKNEGYWPKRYAEGARNYRETRLAEIFTNYQAELARNNALDFDDLILTFCELLKQNLQVRNQLRDQFRHILVDEFQDTNQSQFDLVKLLAGPTAKEAAENPNLNWDNRTLMVVGDVDQSIYSWRKADFRIILGFQDDYKDARLIKLEENYRSTNTILEVANSIIKNNSERIEKVLRSNRGAGVKAKCFEASDEIDEAYFVAEELKRLDMRGRQFSDCAILYRTNSQSRALEEVLVRNHQPYTMVGATRFYDRQEIKDVLAYLRLVYNPSDGQSFLRVVNTPRRGLGKTSIDRLVAYAEQVNTDYLQAASQSLMISDISDKVKKGVAAFASMINRFRTLAGVMSIGDLLELILKDSGYMQSLEEDAKSGTDDLALGRIDNVKELVSVAREFEAIADEPDLEGFLTRIALVSDLDTTNLDQNAVKLMTIHSAKGLEFPVVFVMGLEEGLFPHVRSLNSPAQMEEERRLMYVGVTRAADLVYLTYARMRRSFGFGSGSTNYTIPSRFLSEISPDLITGFYPQTQVAQEASADEIFDDDSSWPPKPSGMSNQQGLRQAPRSESPSFAQGGQAPKPRVLGRYTQEKPATMTPSEDASAIPFEHLSVGDTVQHTKFGIGTITQVIGEKDKELYNVEFKSAGKRLLDPRFAKLVKLN